MWTASDRVASQATAGEDNDCAVLALALVTGASYPNAHAALADLGREPGEATERAALRAALEGWGFEVRRVYSANQLALLTGHHRPTTGQLARDPEAWEVVRRGAALPEAPPVIYL